MAEFAGYKVALARETATPGTYEVFAQIVDLGGPTASSDTIETSHRDSLFRKFQAGMRDAGEVAFNIIFDPDLASHDPTLATSTYKDWENGTARNYKMTFPGTGTKTTTCIFNGVITGYEFDAPLESALGADITIKINGTLTWAHVP